MAQAPRERRAGRVRPRCRLVLPACRPKSARMGNARGALRHCPPGEHAVQEQLMQALVFLAAVVFLGVLLAIAAIDGMDDDL